MGMESIEQLKERIDKLKKELKQVRSQLPMHSIPPAMIMHMDDLEDEILELKKEFKKRNPD
jgi:ribosomal protein L29